MNILEEIREIIEKPGIKMLIRNSGITEKQLTTYILWNKYKEYNQKIHNKVIVVNKMISRGVFYRILSQFRKNVIKAVLTIILLYVLGIMTTEDISSIIEISEVIKSHEIFEDEELLKELLTELKNHIMKIKK